MCRHSGRWPTQIEILTNRLSFALARVSTDGHDEPERCAPPPRAPVECTDAARGDSKVRQAYSMCGSNRPVRTLCSQENVNPADWQQQRKANPLPHPRGPKCLHLSVLICAICMPWAGRECLTWCCLTMHESFLQLLLAHCQVCTCLAFIESGA